MSEHIKEHDKKDEIEAQGLVSPPARFKTISSIAAGTVSANTIFASSDITVTGALVGDFAIAYPPVGLIAGVTWSAIVTAADTIKVRISNPTALGIAVGTGNWGVAIMRG